jgi:hypothetical protein
MSSQIANVFLSTKQADAPSAAPSVHQSAGNYPKFEAPGVASQSFASTAHAAFTPPSQAQAGFNQNMVAAQYASHNNNMASGTASRLTCNPNVANLSDIGMQQVMYTQPNESQNIIMASPPSDSYIGATGPLPDDGNSSGSDSDSSNGSRNSGGGESLTKHAGKSIRNRWVKDIRGLGKLGKGLKNSVGNFVHDVAVDETAKKVEESAEFKQRKADALKKAEELKTQNILKKQEDSIAKKLAKLEVKSAVPTPPTSDSESASGSASGSESGSDSDSGSEAKTPPDSPVLPATPPAPESAPAAPAASRGASHMQSMISTRQANKAMNENILHLDNFSLADIGFVFSPRSELHMSIKEEELGVMHMDPSAAKIAFKYDPRTVAACAIVHGRDGSRQAIQLTNDYDEANCRMFVNSNLTPGEPYTQARVTFYDTGHYTFDINQVDGK